MNDTATTEEVQETVSLKEALERVFEQMFFAHAHLSDIQDGDMVVFRERKGVIVNIEVQNNKKVRFFMLDFATGEEKGFESAPLSSIQIGVFPPEENKEEETDGGDN